MESKDFVKECTDCALCRFTRNAKKPNIFYNIAKAVQKLCPYCRGANKVLDKDFQKSNFF